METFKTPPTSKEYVSWHYFNFNDMVAIIRFIHGHYIPDKYQWAHQIEDSSRNDPFERLDHEDILRQFYEKNESYFTSSDQQQCWLNVIEASEELRGKNILWSRKHLIGTGADDVKYYRAYGINPVTNKKYSAVWVDQYEKCKEIKDVKSMLPIDQ